MINQLNNKNIVIFIFIFILLTGIVCSLFAQDKPDKEDDIRDRKEQIEKKKAEKEKLKKQQLPVSITRDTTKTTPFSKRDTLVTQAVNSNLYWYDADRKIHHRKEIAERADFIFTDEKKLIYRDMSDIIRQKPYWYHFNLMGSGRPAYISGVNAYPHQTSFYYNGVIMNDPIHGMFNSQYMPVNFIRNVQLSPSGTTNMQNFGFGGTSGIHVVSHSRHTKASWTKILYKQGNYGYSDIDISFVKPVTPAVAVQLGGINKVYDGSTFNTDHHGTNYRGEVTWQFADNLYFRGQFFLSRERVGLLFGDGINNPELPRQIELRDDYFLETTWLPSDTISERVHLILFNTYSIRRLKDYSNHHYHKRFLYKRYGVDANYSFPFAKMQLMFGSGFLWHKVWGDGFAKNHYPVYGNIYGSINIPITTSLLINPNAKIIYQKGFSPQLALTLNLEKMFNQNHKISLGIARDSRLPNSTERFFSFDSLYGNNNLVPEEHITANLDYKLGLINDLDIKISSLYTFIKNEIIWRNPNFINRPDRDYLTLAIDINYNFWKINIAVGGFETFSNLYVTSRRGAWTKLHFSDIWLNGALGIDAYGTVQYWGQHNNIGYEPRMERFYLLSGTTDAYWVLNWKIVTTVQDARIFFEMDNSLSQIYNVINRYDEFTQRWRFGVNWDLWD